MAVDRTPDVLDTRQAGGLVVRGGALRVAGYALGSLLSAASAALVARHLGTKDFGGYATVVSLTSIVSALSDAGLSTLAIRDYTQLGGEDREEHLRVLLGLRIVLSTIGGLAAIAFGLAAGFSDALLAGTVLAVAALVVNTIQAGYIVALQALLRLGTIAALDFGRQVLSVIVLTAMVLAGAGVAVLLGHTVLIAVVFLAVTVTLVRGTVPLRPAFAPRRWAGLLRLTVVFALASAVGTLYIYGDQVLTSLASTKHETGLFGISFRIFIVAGAIPGMLVGSAFPVLSRAARDDQDRMRHALQRLFEVSLVAGAGLALIASTGAPLLIKVLGGAQYHGAVPVLRVQGAALLASFLVATWGFALVSLHRHRALVLANLAGLTLSSVLTLSLAPSYGARGTAIATISGEFALGAAYLVALVRTRPDLRPRVAEVWKVALAVAAAVACAVLLPLGLVGTPVVAVAAYALLVLVLRAVPDEVRDLVPQLSRRR